jgi:hypothetical protein
MRSYYLAPQNWDSTSYRDVYDDDDIANLPDSWDADAVDCDYIGEFESIEDAIAAAKQNPEWESDMRR